MEEQMIGATATSVDGEEITTSGTETENKEIRSKQFNLRLTSTEYQELESFIRRYFGGKRPYAVLQMLEICKTKLEGDELADAYRADIERVNRLLSGVMHEYNRLLDMVREKQFDEEASSKTVKSLEIELEEKNQELEKKKAEIESLRTQLKTKEGIEESNHTITQMIKDTTEKLHLREENIAALELRMVGYEQLRAEHHVLKEQHQSLTSLQAETERKVADLEKQIESLKRYEQECSVKDTQIETLTRERQSNTDKLAALQDKLNAAYQARVDAVNAETMKHLQTEAQLQARIAQLESQLSSEK